MKFLLFLLTMVLSFSSCNMMRKASRPVAKKVMTPERSFNSDGIQVPSGYRAELVAKGLTFPTGATFDDEGNLYVVESGFSYEPEWEETKLLKVNTYGTVTTVYKGDRNGPWNGVQYHQGHFYIAEGGHKEGGRILKISKDGETKQVLVKGLPSYGDHHTNGPVVHDGWVYFAQGPATNSGVVGKDNWMMGWLGDHENFSDIPCRDVTLNGVNYTTPDPLSVSPNDTVTTGAYTAFGVQSKQGETIPGKVPCSGAIMRVPLEGGPAELVAWGLRNCFGLAFGPDGQLYATENGYDARGSRPVVGANDHLWLIENGGWYGWPDYSGGTRLDNPSFVRKGEQPIKILLQEHPQDPPEPVAELGVHSSSNGIAFAPKAFGYEGEAFIAQFGDMTPVTGKTISPVGYKIVRVSIETGKVTDFATNKKPGPATAYLGSGGLERPVSVIFSPDGKSLYVVDFGIMFVPPTGPQVQEKSGAIWKITKL